MRRLPEEFRGYKVEESEASSKIRRRRFCGTMKEQIHTENSLSRFFRGQDVKSHLDRLVNLGILEKQVSGGVYTLSDDKSIHDIIKRVNEKDRVARNIVNGVLSQIF